MNNVFEQGFLGMGATLAARLLGTIGEYVMDWQIPGTPSVRTHRYHPVTGILEQFLRFPFPQRLEKFPYGLNVEPP